jgi:hypothetical protein
MNTAAITRRLLSALAAQPVPEAASDAANSLFRTTEEIRRFLTQADRDNTPAVPTEVLHYWRCELDRHHHNLESSAPASWARWRMPGTWLDSQLRLRSLLAHEVGKAYWDDKTDIGYRDIDVERYLWGAR